MALVYRHTLAETFLRFCEVVDVETEGAVVQPVVRVVLGASYALS